MIRIDFRCQVCGIFGSLEVQARSDQTDLVTWFESIGRQVAIEHHGLAKEKPPRLFQISFDIFQEVKIFHDENTKETKQRSRVQSSGRH